jgi:hypothetical protein
MMLRLVNIGWIIKLKELFEKFLNSIETTNTPNVFILSTKQKDIFVNKLGMEAFKNEVRMFGFTVICIVDNISGPIKEEIQL